MRIGFDISQTGQGKAGCGHYAASLLQALLELDRHNEYLLYPQFGPFVWDPSTGQADTWAARSGAAAWPLAETHADLVRLWRTAPEQAEARLGGPDIVHCNSFFYPAGLKQARSVYTLYDLSVVDHPEWTSPGNWWACFSGLMDAAFFADAVIAISAYSRDRFLNFFPFFPPKRIHVMYPGSRFDAPAEEDPGIAGRLGLGARQFWLAVGTLEPRKNLQTLLRAYTEYLDQGGEDLPLVLAGGKGWLIDEFLADLKSGRLADKVIVAGYVSDPELAWLYRHCLGFVYPSMYEGFGLPVLEAMSLKAAVITSDVTSLPEVAGQAALLVHPEDHARLAQAMLRLCREPGLRDDLQAKARIQAERFSWTETAVALLRLYQELPNASRRRGDPESDRLSLWWQGCTHHLHDRVGDLFDRLRGAEAQFDRLNNLSQTLAARLHEAQGRLHKAQGRLDRLEASRSIRFLRKCNILRE